MATNRNSTPAVPTTTAQTDDAARGGLFANPDLTNVVTGVEIAGASMANDSTITINFIETGGSTQTVTFSLNQAANGLFDVTFPTSASPGQGGNPVMSGNLVGTNLILTKADGTTVPPIDLSALDFASQITAINNTLNSLSIPTMTSELTDWPALGFAGQFLELDANRELAWVTPPAARPSSIAADNGVVPLGTGHPAELTGLTIHPNTDLEIIHLDTNGEDVAVTGGIPTGTFRLQEIPTIVPFRPPSGRGTPIDNENVFSPNLPVTTTFDVTPGDNGGGIEMESDITAVVTRTPTGGTAITVPPANIDISRNTPTEFEVTIDDTQSNQEGDYVITPTAIITGDDSMRRPTTLPPVTYNRFIPFFQRATDILQTDLDLPISGDLNPSGAAWNDQLTALTSIPGGILYFAVQASDLPMNTRAAQNRDAMGMEQFIDLRTTFLRAITTLDSEGESITYNVFEVTVAPGFTLHTFRTTRTRP